jgi:type II secretory pathway pseudopilin PulG
MQRKGGFLVRRRGFGIITAIILLVLIATVSAMILSIATTSSKKATDDYLRIQAEMLARSATEFAVMRVQGFNRTGADHVANTADDTCLENLDITAEPYEANVTISYLMAADTACGNELATDVKDTDLNGMTIIDVVVTTKDGTSTEPIRIHKRTLQKP